MTAELFLRRAIALSRENLRAGDGGPFGAVIVRDGQIVSEGRNQVIATNDPTAHAEIVAIRGACRRLGTFSLAGCEIYTSCEPCPMCFGAVAWARLERIYYAATRLDAAAGGFDDSLLYEEIMRPPEQRAIPARQLFAAEARQVFAEWMTHPDKVLY
jgi:guanine deaminase